MLGHIALHQVGRATIGSVALQSGQCVRSVALQSGWSRYNRVGHTVIGLVALLSGLAGVLSLPAFVLLLCTLFPPTPCKGLAFTYTLPYLASVIATLGTCP